MAVEYVKSWGKLQAIKFILSSKKLTSRKLFSIIKEKSMSYIEVDGLVKEIMQNNDECKNILSEIKDKISSSGI